MKIIKKILLSNWIPSFSVILVKLVSMLVWKTKVQNNYLSIQLKQPKMA